MIFHLQHNLNNSAEYSLWINTQTPLKHFFLIPKYCFFGQPNHQFIHIVPMKMNLLLLQIVLTEIQQKYSLSPNLANRFTYMWHQPLFQWSEWELNQFVRLLDKC